MRIAMIAETFTPAVNGVVNTVRHVAAELVERGHEVVVVAPTGASFAAPQGSVEVVRVPSVAVPGYRSLRIARPGLELVHVMHHIDPDVVHLASPAVLGLAGARAARALGLPCLAVFQTDLAAFVARHWTGVPVPPSVRHRLGERVWQRLKDLHDLTDLTLAPSGPTRDQLHSRGIGPLAVWPRGVDTRLFHPVRRDLARRDALCNGRPLLVGTVSRLANEKRLELLADLARRPEVRLVIIGDGPRRRQLEAALPHAVFLGQRTGIDLAASVASLDVLVHPGADETFCQSVQEALASGVPAVVAAAGGPLDLVDHGVNGLLWHDDDPATLGDLVTSLADPTTRLRLATAARPSVAHRTWSAVTTQLIEHYATIGATAATARARHPSRSGRRTA